MDQATVSQPGTVAIEPPSTVLNPQTVNTTSGGGTPDLREPSDAGSVESVLEAELARLKAGDEKVEKSSADAEKAETKEPEKSKETKPEKADKEAKAEEKPQRGRTEDGKFAKAEKTEEPVKDADGVKGEPDKAATGQDGTERSRPSEGRQHHEPPARFLPKEKEAWGNVPNVVKAAFDRISREHETEVQQYRSSHEEWTKLDKFQQMAKQHNTNVSDALERYTALDGLMSSNPIEGIRQILATRGITPVQYAEHVLQNPDLHKAPVQRAPDPQVQHVNSEVAQLREQVATLQQDQIANTVVLPFMNDRDEKGELKYPRFAELQNDIAFFLGSGRIPASLSPVERLAAAYDMAERINPRSVPAPQQDAPAQVDVVPDRPAKLDAGQKSIRGAPSDGEDTAVEEADQDLRGLLRKELRRMSA